MCVIEDLNPTANPLEFAREYAGVQQELAFNLNWAVAIIRGDKNQKRREAALKLFDKFFDLTGCDHLDDATHWVKGQYRKGLTIEEELEMVVSSAIDAYGDLIRFKRKFDPDYVPQEYKSEWYCYVDDNDTLARKTLSKIVELYE